MAHPTFQSAFSRIFDVAIFGTGYAAFGAALHVRQKGKSVCLVSRQSDLLWESGRAFMPCAGVSDNPLWRNWMAELESRNATAEGDIDGALAEIIGTEIIAQKGIDALYYSTPVGIETSGDALEAVIVATKSGHRRLIARQWIDATETGEVIGLLRPDLQPRAPETRHLFAYYQSVHWPGRNAHEISAGEAHITWSPALWPRQRRVAIALPGHTERPRAHIIPALRELFQALGDRIKDAAMSHCSLLDCPEYAHGHAPSFSLPKNVLSAAPALSGQAIATLADRFVLGVDAVREAATHDPPADIRTRPIRVPVRRQNTTDVFVAGAGTGGAYAAIAAARAGAKVTAVEPCEFPGGIGAGGGIHWYYFGVPGGLQAEADQRTLDVMPLFGGQTHIRGFHPEARKLILEEMFDEAGVDFRKGAMVCAAHKTGRTVTRVTIATAQGLIDISARAFIDATGDGDLCVQAGAEFTFGRTGDGLVHAYSQSGGRIGERNGVLTVEHMNFDAGFTDPTDAEDLTRARLSGIRHYLQDRFDDASRWTYIAPAIGLRQSRQIKTDYMVSLADLIERRKFPDAIGYTGAHYDNHAVDYEFESDEGLFWVWLCRQWREGRTACEIPYRMMLPKDLDNVWIACRAAGVSQDAHHSLRMQRDIQRLGEAAGNAAAISAQRACGAREVPFVELRDRLAQTGALDLEKSNLTLDFGPTDGINTLKELRDEIGISEEQVAEGLKDLQAGKPSRAIWYLYRAKDRVQADVFNALGSDNLVTSWLAAGILAQWGDARAERRLLNAIRTEEYGYESEDEAKTPEKNNRVVPNWMAAISFLRCCGTRQTLPVFQDFAAQTSLSLNVRTGMALTLERLIDRGVLDESDKKTAARLVEMLLSGKMPGAVEIPQRNLAATMNADGPLKRGGPAGKTQDDYRWQIVLVLSRISKKLGLPVPEEAKTFKRDPRALVRRAFADI